MSIKSLEINVNVPPNIQKTNELDQKIHLQESENRSEEINKSKQKDEETIPQKLTIDKSKEDTSSLKTSSSSSNTEDDSPLKLKYSRTTFYIILIINIFLPGIGTIIAGIGWGSSCKIKNRTKELIFRGIFQFFTLFLIVGFIKAIQDAKNYFK